MIQIEELEVDGKGLRFPNLSQERKLISGDRPTAIRVRDGFSIAYDPQTAVYTVGLGPVVRMVHASRVVWAEPAKELQFETIIQARARGGRKLGSKNKPKPKPGVTDTTPVVEVP